MKWREKCSPDAELQSFKPTTQHAGDNAGIMFVVDVIIDGSEHTTNILDNLKTAQRRFPKLSVGKARTQTITTAPAALPV